MFICNDCGKKFKTMQALGGHVGRAHPRDREAEPSQAVGQVPPVEKTVEPGPVPPDQPGHSRDDPGVLEGIRELLRQRYTPKQIKEQFGYARSTVDQVVAEAVQPEGKPEDGDAEPGLPVTVKGSEIITPEFIMYKLANGSDDWRLRLEGMMLLRAAQKMNRDDIEMIRLQTDSDAKKIEPMLRMLEAARRELDAAEARAKGSSHEMAQEAAEEVAGRMVAYLEQKAPQAPAGPPPKDMNETVARRFDKIWEYLEHVLMKQLMPGQSGPPSGWEYSKEQLQAPGHGPVEPKKNQEGGDR